MDKKSTKKTIFPIGVIFDPEDDKSWCHWGVQFQCKDGKLSAEVPNELAEQMIACGRAK